MEEKGTDMSHTTPPIRRALRLSFHVSKGKVSLVSHERVDMICPPSIGEAPVIGKYGGFWLEARTADGRVVFHRRLNDPLGTSVAVHSPDGRIERIFGEPRDDHDFEVLLPDDPAIHSVVLVGHVAGARAAAAQGATEPTPAASRELGSFEIPAAAHGGRP
jgi:hypothetical protein